jgi:uncharacterized coiled-coil protein SlyX
MSKNSVVVRTAQDLVRKNNFASLLGLKKNIEITNQGIQKVENELNNMLNTLTINLKGVLDSQGEVSLWFYSGIPTTSNEPYTLWENPNDHIGDIYYDQSSGIVYQFNGEWETNNDEDLVEAMAITNAEIDTETDHQRQVFFNTPTPPYSNGDWWVKEDGSLFICQISKPETETYENNDFIISNQYVNGTFATKVNERLTIIEGTVTTIEESNDNLNIEIVKQQQIVEDLGNDVSTITDKVIGVEESNNTLNDKVVGVEEANNTLNSELIKQQETQKDLNDRIVGLGGILEDMTFNFNTKGLSVGTSLDPNNSLLDNTGIKVYNYNKLNAIFNNKGSGIDKLIVTGQAQLGYLRFNKSTKNNKPVTKIFHLKSLIEDLEDLM